MGCFPSKKGNVMLVVVLLLGTEMSVMSISAKGSLDREVDTSSISVLSDPQVSDSLLEGLDINVNGRYGRRRVLQQEDSTNSCEFDVSFSINAITKNDVTSSISVTNNRELPTPVQVVYSFGDSTAMALETVTNALLVSKGNTDGAPIRFRSVDSIKSEASEVFKLNSKFINIDGSDSPSPMTRLDLENLNLNGAPCSLQGQNALTYNKCFNALSFFQSFNGRVPPTNIDGCTLRFCCGQIMKKETKETPTKEEEKLEAIVPAAAPESEGFSNASAAVVATGAINDTKNPKEDFQSANYQSPAVDVSPSPSPPVSDSSSETNSGSNMGPIIGAIAGVAAVLVIAAILSILFIRSRRKQRISPEKTVSSSPSSNPPGKSQKSVALRAMTGASIFSRGGGTTTGQATMEATSSYEMPCSHSISSGKVLQTAYTSNSREMDSFRQEITVLSRLRHPNIIAFLAACTIPPDICIIEELADGGSLHTRLHGPSGSSNRCRPLPLMSVLQIGIDIAHAMVYLHPNIVHRDLKSQNVLLDSDGRAKVCDFGIAKFKDRTFVSTVNGQAGTPAYMAPELFDGANVTEKVDVYSFSILLWECLTGKIPWGSIPSPMQIIYYVGVLAQRPKMPSTAPENLKLLIEDCWQTEPTARPDFKDVLSRLQKMQQDMWSDGTGTLTSLVDPEEDTEESATDDTDDEEESIATRSMSTVGPVDEVYRKASMRTQSISAHALRTCSSTKEN
eukprot:jgi/Picsp_1/5243/NSC_02606-R1_protein